MALKVIITASIALILLILTIKNYHWGLYIFVFLCPIIPPAISLYISDNIPLITFQRIMLAILVSVWGIKYLMGKIQKIEKPPLIELLLVFIGFVLISSFLSSEPKIALKEFFSERIIGIPLIYFLFFQIIYEKQIIKNIICVLLISTFIIALCGIIEEITQKNLFYEFGKYLIPTAKLNALGFVDNAEGSRFGVVLVNSSFPISNGLAAYLLFVFPLALVALSFCKNKLMAILWGTVILAFFTCLIFTASLGGYLGLGITLAIFWGAKRPSVAISGIVLFVIIVVGWFYFSGVLAKERGLHRFWQIIDVCQTVIQHPLGVGLTRFNEDVKVSAILDDLPSSADGYAYSQQIVAETGILSFIVLIAIWIILLRRIKNSSQQFHQYKDCFWGAVMWSLFTAIVVNLILSTITHSILNTFNGIIIFWVLAAIAMRLWVISNNRSEVPAESA